MKVILLWNVFGLLPFWAVALGDVLQVSDLSDYSLVILLTCLPTVISVSSNCTLKSLRGQDITSDKYKTDGLDICVVKSRNLGPNGDVLSRGIEVVFWSRTVDLSRYGIYRVWPL